MRLAITSLLLCSLPSSLALAEKPQLKQSRLWYAGEDGYDTYRIPGIVVTANGTLVAYGVARRNLKDGDWGDNDIVMRRSTDHGKHWEKSRRIAGDSHGVTDNPVAIASRAGRVLHFLYQHDYANVYYMKSQDDGATFSEPVDITSALTGLRSQFDWNVVALGPGHAIELMSGRLLVPVWLAAAKVQANGHRGSGPSGITTIYSDDQGATWTHGDIIALSSSEMKNPNEFQVIQLADGSVMANIRTGDRKLMRAVALSPDGISHWSKPQFDPHLYDPVCAAGITPYDDRRLLFTNPDSSTLPRKSNGEGLRQNLTIRLSADDGKTWPISQLLVMGPTGYSDIAVDPHRKEIFDIYEMPDDTKSKALSLYIAAFNLEWLEKK
ncbi:MAG: sialidase family protein [Acidobacteriota bacterium]